jgi:hypothetical protein
MATIDSIKGLSTGIMPGNALSNATVNPLLIDALILTILSKPSVVRCSFGINKIYYLFEKFKVCLFLS